MDACESHWCQSKTSFWEVDRLVLFSPRIFCNSCELFTFRPKTSFQKENRCDLVWAMGINGRLLRVQYFPNSVTLFASCNQIPFFVIVARPLSCCMSTCGLRRRTLAGHCITTLVLEVPPYQCFTRHCISGRKVFYFHIAWSIRWKIDSVWTNPNGSTSVHDNLAFHLGVRKT